jgi:hypothetical protein
MFNGLRIFFFFWCFVQDTAGFEKRPKEVVGNLASLKEWGEALCSGHIGIPEALDQ